jgi:hypothetical protein
MPAIQSSPYFRSFWQHPFISIFQAAMASGSLAVVA